MENAAPTSKREKVNKRKKRNLPTEPFRFPEGEHAPKFGEDHRIAFPASSGLKHVRVGDIVRIEGEACYSNVFLRNSPKFLVSRNLSRCMIILKDCGFFRVHNSHIINPRDVVGYVNGKGGTIILYDGSRVPLSRHLKKSFREAYPNV